MRRTKEILVVHDLARFFKTIPQGSWSDAPKSAAIVPIRASNLQQLAGFAIVGLSSRLKFEQAYIDFLELIVALIASAISNARAYEMERKRAEALAEIDRAKTAFFSNVSHEFRTPLILMLGPLDRLLSNRTLSPETRNKIEIAHRNSLRLLKLVNTLLDFSRIEAGRVRAAYRKEDLSQLTREITSNFASAIEAAGLRRQK